VSLFLPTGDEANHFIEQQDLADARFSRLLGEGGIGRQDKIIFLKKSTMFTSDFQLYLQYCDPYVFHDILPHPYGVTDFQLKDVIIILRSE
jgi:hypothetical protein